jgi:hypothetical protein
MGMERRALRGPVGTGGIGWWSRILVIPKDSGRAEEGSVNVGESDSS